MIDLIYAIIGILFSPFILLRLLYKRQVGLINRRFFLRLANIENSIWIHAVSVGEIKSLESTLYEIEKIFPQIVISVTTPAGYEIARKLFKKYLIIHSPLDFSFVIKKYVDKINPRLMIFNELELWPNWVRVLKKRKIPIVLINGRISAGAFKRYQLFSFIFKKTFSRLDLCLVQSERIAAMFRKLGVSEEKIRICGNIKADQALQTITNLPKKEQILTALKIKTKKLIVVAGSTHLCDERILAPVVKEFKEQIFFIVAPRHPERRLEIGREFEKFELKSAFFSRGDNPEEADLLIYDQLGFLPALYKIADLIILGGTQEKKIGGHNFYEAAVFNRLILGGVYYNNFFEIAEELKRNRIYHIFRSPAELKQLLTKFINQREELLSVEGEKIVARFSGAQRCTIEYLKAISGC